MPVIPGEQWLNRRPKCRWRWRDMRTDTVYACDSRQPEARHDRHFTNGSPSVVWYQDNPAAFYATEPESPTLTTRIQVSPVQDCANLQCPNQAHEGRMTVFTAFTSRAGAKRDVTLLLCAPCADYLSRL